MPTPWGLFQVKLSPDEPLLLIQNNKLPTSSFIKLAELDNQLRLNDLEDSSQNLLTRPKSASEWVHPGQCGRAVSVRLESPQFRPLKYSFSKERIYPGVSMLPDGEAYE